MALRKNSQPEDSSGHMLEIGDIVAFNRSGVVRRGRVKSISPRTDGIARRNPSLNCVQWIVEIERPDGEPSVVKNTDGILII